MESVAEEILREILLRLPARDVIRSGCVCRLWRRIVVDPSFKVLHGNSGHAVSGTDAETLLVPEFRVMEHGMGLEMTITRAASTKPICRFTDLAAGYSPVNACNGFLLIASHVKYWPLYVCNPVTGEKLKIPAPPKIKRILWRMYAMGYSPSTREHKLFRISFDKEGNNHLDVYTLGSSDGWRRHPRQFPYCAEYGIRLPPPVLIDGKIYVMMAYSRTPGRILVIDVASEARCTYRLPEDFTRDGEVETATPDRTLASDAHCPEDFMTDVATVVVHALELRGRLCVAMRFVGWPRLCFWIMPSLKSRRLCDDRNDTCLPGWERRYTFYVDTKKYANQPCGVWLNDGNKMLCYRLGDLLYKYDTTKEMQRHKHIFEWDFQIKLPPTNFAMPDDLQWNVYGGYRPSLLSPHLAFAPASLLQQLRYEQEDCEQALMHATLCCDKWCSTCAPSNHPGHPAKRYREPTHDS